MVCDVYGWPNVYMCMLVVLLWNGNKNNILILMMLICDELGNEEWFSKMKVAISGGKGKIGK